jgi:hypothetical protein
MRASCSDARKKETRHSILYRTCKLACFIKGYTYLFLLE